ncbi:SAM-dependent DNA methyltransferase [Micromonospora sp. WMMD956]|uniref:Eco57I restriction-modification methylase domain-containing protein n=1 Tax=Micromonospora sp. WMMD956 TaxID=3016108 RepID=UPI002417D818|nr:type IIL restriction-modification enzyme MmeI [Micromonospora sp. WMMD956]MDG4817508.1 SAM-dependent DNA methyltransferase [Micromonospora sp. WMMD956]
MSRTFRRPAPDGVEQHRNWLSLVEVSGPFLSLPVLRRTWPTLDTLDRRGRDRLRQQHTTWQADTVAGQADWIGYVLDELLGWGDARHTDGLDALAHTVAEHDTELRPSFVLVKPGEAVKPDGVRLIGLVCPSGQQPTARITGSTWAATPADRLALLCRHHRVELGLATDGRWWTLVWAPRGGVTTTATFDAVAWPEAAERDVVRAFVSLLSRHRFFGVPDAERLVPLLRDSLGSQEEITEALGVQVRQAVELLVAAIGRTDVRERDAGGPGLAHVEAHEVYRGAVAVMMRIVFLLFAEERRLLPADNELYAAAYSAGRLCAELEQRVTEGSEEDLEHSSAAWHRLLALFTAVYHGIDHPRLTLHGHDGSLFDPKRYDWLPLAIDDRTVLHMLRSVQYVQVGTGRSRERRTVSFRTLDVEQIGYVYEGLLSFEGFRAQDVTVGLIGKEGLEDEVALADLETLRERHPDVASLAKALAERHKDSKIGSPAALAKKLVPLDGAEREEARRKLLAVTGGDYPLSERLLPFHGIIRADLRGLPVVILPGALFVTESALRRNTGTHYTPRFLAEEVVEGALEPLVYEPGPLQTADRAQWKPKSSKEILALKVADIAMGSAAFLVAAARYLAGHLIAAWSREGDEVALAYQQRDADRTVDADDDPLVVEARRQIIEHCLYGVDINPMAVEMAKLSLWLVSMDPHRPFTFLDDRLVAGDALLGLGNAATLPGKAARDLRLERDLAEARKLRQQLADLPDRADTLSEKRRLLDEVRTVRQRADAYADLVVGAQLASVKRGRDQVVIAERVGALAQQLAKGGDVELLLQQARAWLATDQPDGGFDRDPLHWPLEFPEVFEQGGFDAIIGNPPFLGGKKISGPLGTAYRECLVTVLGRGVKGNADLVAYFLLRAHDLLNPGGQTGLIATNTLAQGDTREVGLDQVTAGGAALRKSIKSKPWPSPSAALEYCAVWTSRATVSANAERVADGVIVKGITSSLAPVTRTAGNPHRLVANERVAFIGSYVLGMGFVMEPSRAEELISVDSRNREVLFPYLNGKDLNSRPDCSGSRWVINFFDWPVERARWFREVFEIVEREVRPERQRRKADGTFVLRKPLPEKYWQYAEKQPAMQQAIAGLNRVVVLAQVSKTVLPLLVPTGQVFANKIVVFAVDDTAMLALLSSAPHYWWTTSRSSTMKADLSYSPSDVIATFALPELTAELRALGDRLDTYRRDVMLSRDAGLTATYNLVFDPGCQDDDIVELRRIHRDIDVATCRAYGWDDLVEEGLDHGFHKAGAYVRYTVGPAVQREILDRLLELNHERYAEEVAQGLHDKKKSGRKPPSGPATLF